MIPNIQGSPIIGNFASPIASINNPAPRPSYTSTMAKVEKLPDRVRSQEPVEISFFARLKKQMPGPGWLKAIFAFFLYPFAWLFSQCCSSKKENKKTPSQELPPPILSLQRLQEEKKISQPLAALAEVTAFYSDVHEQRQFIEQALEKYNREMEGLLQKKKEMGQEIQKNLDDLIEPAQEIKRGYREIHLREKKQEKVKEKINRLWKQHSELGTIKEEEQKEREKFASQKQCKQQELSALIEEQQKLQRNPRIFFLAFLSNILEDPETRVSELVQLAEKIVCVQKEMQRLEEQKKIHEQEGESLNQQQQEIGKLRERLSIQYTKEKETDAVFLAKISSKEEALSKKRQLSSKKNKGLEEELHRVNKQEERLKGIIHSLILLKDAFRDADQCMTLLRPDFVTLLAPDGLKEKLQIVLEKLRPCLFLCQDFLRFYEKKKKEYRNKLKEVEGLKTTLFAAKAHHLKKMYLWVSEMENLLKKIESSQALSFDNVFSLKKEEPLAPFVASEEEKAVIEAAAALFHSPYPALERVYEAFYRGFASPAVRQQVLDKVQKALLSLAKQNDPDSYWLNSAEKELATSLAPIVDWTNKEATLFFFRTLFIGALRAHRFIEELPPLPIRYLSGYEQQLLQKNETSASSKESILRPSSYVHREVQLSLQKFLTTSTGTEHHFYAALRPILYNIGLNWREPESREKRNAFKSYVKQLLSSPQEVVARTEAFLESLQ